MRRGRDVRIRVTAVTVVVAMVLRRRRDGMWGEVVAGIRGIAAATIVVVVVHVIVHG